MTADGNAVTPYAVESDDLDYEKLLARFGADELTDDQRARFPDHPLVNRGLFYAGRDVDDFLTAGEQSIVTGVGPSGPMHLGHAMVFYFARRLQDEFGARVYVPLSDDEKYWFKDQTPAETGDYLRANLRDLLAVGFDPELTRIVVDTRDADVLYPLATAFAGDVRHATLQNVYGEPDNVGQAFYPAVQTAHLLLPQLVHGEHETLVPIAVDQDPHVRVSRDVAAKARYPVGKPGALLMQFLPSLAGPGKMSSSAGVSIRLTDSPDTVREKVRTHAYTGGRASVEEHRAKGGVPAEDVPFQYLSAFFEPDDAELARIEREYRAGDLLSGELKDLAADRITEFLAAHQRRRAALGDVTEALDAFRLTDDERQRARDAVGFGY
ncbi:tryptophan--tRNA ligase [Halobacterium salinarum]|uniref:Tryptophan--tRNA ligase n=1 Tax=Halobacterium salinarum (strain ATCC 33171 / DSM 3754 / JCM 8978 / NBRC 102687 / NCIMB 764 / 91-R6) TaxID=2597657 RepID=A0A4D6GVU6_HALS9|nr:tryptophan--tRNA ligase [Halobacterium salinarum]MDL0136449.1 tryptophan--tRNA ligase [Halobacterium salinarum]MDL0145065.1 tryptophan--tRNA ligase [Halobacterium salinarum]QCC45845.1 tryptophan--tRNA ligase [Halobacterium salinarum]TYO82104.1 tryptophanyl-tRNA synthetase [Halobacterium salinarum DSM 3754]